MTKQKVLRHGNSFAARVRRRYFSEGEKRGLEICLLFTGWEQANINIISILSILLPILIPLGGVQVTPGRLTRRSEFTPVPSHGSIFVYTIPPQNVMPAWVTLAWAHPGSCTGARISLLYEISQRYHVSAKRPPVSAWNRSANRLERVAHA